MKPAVLQTVFKELRSAGEQLSASPLFADEVEREGHPFRAKSFFSFMTKWVAPLLLIAILVSEICRNCLT